MSKIIKMNVETKEGNKSSLKAFDLMSPCSQFSIPFILFQFPLGFLFIFHFVNCFPSSISSLEYWDVKTFHFISFHNNRNSKKYKNKINIKNCQLLSICHFRSKDKWTSNNLRIKINTFHSIYLYIGIPKLLPLCSSKSSVLGQFIFI